MRVALHIDRLVVDGTALDPRALPAHRERAFREALTAELTALLTRPAPWEPRAVRRAETPLGAPAPPDGPAAYGRAVARSVYAALDPAAPARPGERRP
ncbi:hypothetical protein GCM10010302_64970 [Streptomyces polychromogenes]|uniref:Uncharacterized protein n=1 Tax=Streptomyces polychromogenes TaxID=67342 RepID=A0ABN0VTE7_9ACTN